MADGLPVVLTADPTLMADYPILLDGMLVASQTTTTPAPLIQALLMPRRDRRGIRARVAPLGLRRVEAALIDGGFTPEELAVVHPAQLSDAVGPDTRVVGVSCGEPTGAGMSSTTLSAVAGGRCYPAVAFGKLMRRIRRVLQAASAPAKVVVGGAGVWQVAGDPAAGRAFGIDHVITGYAEGNVARILRDLMAGGSLPDVIPGEPVGPGAIPRVRGASTMGVVEISRGCGLGCAFCTLARVPMAHLPRATVLADAKTNVTAGVRNLCVISEDIFRYGAAGLETEPGALLSLLEALREIDGLGLIQTDHANILSASCYSDEQLARTRALMVGPTGQQFPWVNVGVETAAGALLRANGGGAKMGRWADEEWGEVCRTQLRRLCRAGFFPFASLIVGLPGETDADTRRTLDWVESISAERLAVFPVLYAPVDGGAAPAPRRLQWQLIRACYRLNARWMARVYWDNQRAGGVGPAKRCLMRVLGHGQILLWKTLLALRTWSAE